MANAGEVEVGGGEPEVVGEELEVVGEGLEFDCGELKISDSDAWLTCKIWQVIGSPYLSQSLFLHLTWFHGLSFVKLDFQNLHFKKRGIHLPRARYKMIRRHD